MKKHLLKKIFHLSGGLILVLLLGMGFFGQGIDVVYSYRGELISVWNPKEFVGGILATFVLFEFYLGVYLISLFIFLALSKFFIIELKKYSFTFFLLICFMMLGYPLYLGMTNALRQGVALGFFVYFVSELKNNNKISFSLKNIFLLSCLFFSHSFGALLVLNFCLYYLLNKIFRNSFIYVSIFSGLLLITIDVLRGVGEYAGDPTGSDNRLPMFVAICFVIFFYSLKFKNSKFIYEEILFYYIISLFVFSLRYLDNSLVYERLMWVPLLSTLLLFPRFFSDYCNGAVLKLALLTIYGLLAFLNLIMVGFNYYD